MVNVDLLKKCDHKRIVKRKNGSFYCRDCGYDSQRDNKRGKLSNLMNQLQNAREANKELGTIFANTTSQLQERIRLLKEIIKDKDTEIRELKEQVGAMLDEKT